MKWCLGLSTVMFLPVVLLSAQQESNIDAVKPAVKILEPGPEALLAGEQTLKAAVTPESTAVTSLEFFVDGAPTSACKQLKPPYECRQQFGEKIAAHSIRAVANLADGRWVATTVRTTAGIEDKVEVIAVSVPVVVTDYRGKFVKGLTQQSFHVFENGVPQVITYVDIEQVPVDVVIAVDISGSMAQSMPKLKATVKKFLESLATVGQTNAHVNITVLAFNDRPFVIATREETLARKLAAIDKLQATGRTSLYDAILQSIDLLGKDISRKAIIVFTDGEDRSSLASIEPVEKRLRDSDAAVYMITQGRGAAIDAVRKIVNHIAEISGGRRFETEKIDQLQEALTHVMDDLTHQYLIGYSPSNTAHDGAYRKITVRTTVNSHEVRAREGYQAPAK